LFKEKERSNKLKKSIKRMGLVVVKQNEKFSVADEMDQFLPSFNRFWNLKYSPLHVSVERMRCWEDV